MKGEDSLQETLLKVGLRIAKRGEGALIVVGDVPYKTLVNQTVPPFNVRENPKLLESLALIDGAVVLDKKGFLKAYGVMIKSRKVFKNYGTRHAAALSAAEGDNLVMIVSEEDRKVKILKKGKMIMQFDGLQKGAEKSVHGAANMLEAIGAGTIGALGTSLFAPTVGIALIPGVIVFGSAYYLMKVINKGKFGQ